MRRDGRFGDDVCFVRDLEMSEAEKASHTWEVADLLVDLFPSLRGTMFNSRLAVRKEKKTQLTPNFHTNIQTEAEQQR